MMFSKLRFWNFVFRKLNNGHSSGLHFFRRFALASSLVRMTETILASDVNVVSVELVGVVLIVAEVALLIRLVVYQANCVP